MAVRSVIREKKVSAPWPGKGGEGGDMAMNNLDINFIWLRLNILYDVIPNNVLLLQSNIFHLLWFMFFIHDFYVNYVTYVKRPVAARFQHSNKNT